MFKRKSLIALAAVAVMTIAACGSFAANPSAEINWPANVTIVVSAGPGGDTDFNARLLAAELSKYLPPNFVVSNVVGSGGVTGLRQVATGPMDGSTAAMFHSAFVVNQLTGIADFGFEAYEFGAIVAAHPGMVLLVRPELGVNTLEELFEYTKANPGKLLYGVETGAVSFAVGVLLTQNGLDVTLVDAGPTAERITMLLGGHVDIIASAFGLVADYIKEGMFIPLGIDGVADLHAPGFDVIECFVTQGFDIKVPFYYFMAFPAGTDPNLVAAVNEVIERTVRTNTEYREAITTFYQSPFFAPGAEGLAIFEEVYQILSQVDFN